MLLVINNTIDENINHIPFLISHQGYQKMSEWFEYLRERRTNTAHPTRTLDTAILKHRLPSPWRF